MRMVQGLPIEMRCQQEIIGQGKLDRPICGKAPLAMPNNKPGRWFEFEKAAFNEGA